MIAASGLGCVRRTAAVNTEPPGALVYLNGQEAGRTPFQRDFTWYGTYDVVIRKEGYQTLRTRQPVIAPWWQWPPFDLFAELFPVTDSRSFTFVLEPAADAAIDVDEILARADGLRGRLESSQAPPPTTRPAP